MSAPTTMVPEISGICVDVPMDAGTSQLGLQQWTCNGNAAQDYVFTQQANGSYQIKTSNGLCLDSWGGDRQVVQYGCNSGPNQSWTLRQADLFGTNSSSNVTSFTTLHNKYYGAQFYNRNANGLVLIPNVVINGEQ